MQPGYTMVGVMVMMTIFTGLPGKPGDFNFIYPGPEIAWNLPPKVQNTCTKQEI